MDLIERQEALDCFQDWMDKYGDVHIADEMTEYRRIEQLPSVQPEQPEWVQKVERYINSAPAYVHNPLAWALYQTWKEYDK